jgi:hypothetical protein
VGVPVSFADKDTNELIWRVSFDDGDEGDYNARELQKIMCAAEDAELCEDVQHAGNDFLPLVKKPAPLLHNLM